MKDPASTPDILLFLSDQHHGRSTGYAGRDRPDTPNLDRIAANGTICETAYTACPLCVPARSALLTGQFTSRNGMFDNSAVLPSDQATFLNSLVDAGYETVLCGRMHFKGADQRHGFTKRIMGDITRPYADGVVRDGVFTKVFGMGGCLDLIGLGTSPVLEYDRATVAAALDFLGSDHERPQCLVVGTYGPHFPYVAPSDLFERYRGRVSTPSSWNPEAPDPNPIIDAKRQRTRTNPVTGEQSPVTTEVMLAARAVYYAMITEQDRHVGSVRAQWHDYLARTGRPGVFVYASDHGDTCGEHGVFGKQTFYEGSTRIPLVFEGSGIVAGRRIANPVSIMDIGPTLCEFAGGRLPAGLDGRSLATALRDGRDVEPRPVISEWVQEFGGDSVPGRMVRSGRWKLVHYRHDDVPTQLFDLEVDPDELTDCASEYPETVGELMQILESGWEPERIARQFAEKQQHRGLIRSWVDVCDPDVPESEQWRVTPESIRSPDPIV